MHIGIIGGGFTGCLLAVHLLRQASPGTAISIIERSGLFGRGAAYGTENPEHLLNVRAGNMGAFPDDPRHFHAWLAARGEDVPPETAFVSRQRYGEYVAEIFERAVAAAAGRVAISMISALAVALEAGERPTVSLEDGRCLSFDRVALCFGNLPPADAPGLSEAARASANYIHDPWGGREVRAIPAGADVLIAGSGLTMADIVQSLAGQGHTGRINVISRHGLVPLRHQVRRPVEIARPEGPLLTMFRAMRATADEMPARGSGWRDAIDALRPWTSEIWRTMSDADRRRFVRHVRPYWEVLRHRLAPATADTLDRLQGLGQIDFAAGRILSVDWREGRFDIAVRPRGASGSIRFTPAWLVNCTGPQADYARCSNPLLRNAARAGVIRADSLRLGLDVSAEGAVIGTDGKASTNIFAVGPPTRGAFWEIVAVPDIRQHCARVAGVMLKGL